MRASPRRSASLASICALSGGSLLAASELADRLEPDLGLNALDLYFALALAVVVVLTSAVAGDIVLYAIERRTGHRPAPRLATWLLTAAGTGAVVEIAIHHLRHAPAIDASLGLTGGLLLLVAGLRRHALAVQQGRFGARAPATTRATRPQSIRISLNAPRRYLSRRADRHGAKPHVPRPHVLARIARRPRRRSPAR